MELVVQHACVYVVLNTQRIQIADLQRNNRDLQRVLACLNSTFCRASPLALVNPVLQDLRRVPQRVHQRHVQRDILRSRFDKIMNEDNPYSLDVMEAWALHELVLLTEMSYPEIRTLADDTFKSQEIRTAPDWITAATFCLMSGFGDYPDEEQAKALALRNKGFTVTMSAHKTPDQRRNIIRVLALVAFSHI